MATPLSLRVARSLLALAGGLALATVLFITAASQDRIGAAPWLLLLLLTSAGFFAAALLLSRQPYRAKALAVAAATAMGALGVITGFGAGLLSFPAAAVGVLAAWAALLHPPTRRIVVAFALYLAIGVVASVLTAGPALISVFTLIFVLLWPGRLVLIPAASFTSIFVLLGLAISFAVYALVGRRAVPRAVPVQWWVATIVVGIAAGVAAVGLFVAYANARPETSARFDLVDPLVLAVVFGGGLAAISGGICVFLWRRPLAALALGLGVAALFMTFGARPAVACMRNGTSNGTPLAWSLRAPFEGGSTAYTSSGGGTSGGTTGSIGGGVSSGELRFGPHHATYRCEGDRLVEFRETP
jgi:hypothetical protein